MTAPSLQSLNDALKKSPVVLGKDYEKLGKASNFSSKPYLSFTTKGFNVLTLNTIQRIFRKVFMFYPDTHSKFVLTFIEYEFCNPALNAEEKKLVKKMCKKFEEIVLQKYSKKDLMPIFDWRITCPQWFATHGIKMPYWPRR